MFHPFGIGKLSDCIFCKIVDHQIASDIVYEDDDVLAFNDITPQAPVHVLIIPKKHVSSVNELADSNADVIGTLVIRAKQLARERGIDESGYRLIINCNAQGGQTVFHIHLHLMGGRQLGALG